MSDALLTLGRDGMGDEATEADYYACVSFVCERIDEATGLVVDVDMRMPRDVQSNSVTRCTGDEADIVREALDVLWEAFCAAGQSHVRSARRRTT